MPIDMGKYIVIAVLYFSEIWFMKYIAQSGDPL